MCVIQQHVPTQTLLQDQFRVVSLLVVNMGTPNPEEPQNHRKIRTSYTQERMNKGSTHGKKKKTAELERFNKAIREGGA